jgi:O-antigen/teichoic acid export membrane protein
VIAVVTPTVATLYGAGAIDKIRSGYGRALRLLTIGTLPVTVLTAALGPALLRLLGRDFHHIGTILVVMMITFPLVPLQKTAAGLLHGLGRLRFILLSGAFAAVANIGLDVFFIPRWDAVGAAVANGGAQLAAAVPTLIYASRILGGLDWRPSFLIRAIPASAATGAASWAAAQASGGGAVGVAVGAVAGVATFVVFAGLFRILPAQDAAWLDGHLGARLGGRVGRAVRLCAPRFEPT